MPLCEDRSFSEIEANDNFCYYKPNLCQVKMSTSNCDENSEIYY